MEKKLQRNEQDKMIAGVCAGLADYFDVDVSWVRIAFVVAVIAGAGLLAYIILWIAVPPRPFTPDFGKYNVDYKVYDKAYPTDPILDPAFSGIPAALPKKRGSGRIIAGVLFVTFGFFFMLSEFDLIPYWFDIHKLWPVILIVIGIYILLRSGKKEPWKPDPAKEPDFTEPGINTSESTEEAKSNTDQSTSKPL